ncbi:hypothetical protein BUE76_06765 [Cnuella takakiae]|nr:hypothetical protein BUE76_06765 [Cnuella takakiae]
MASFIFFTAILPDKPQIISNHLRQQECWVVNRKLGLHQVNTLWFFYFIVGQKRPITNSPALRNGNQAYRSLAFMVA